MKTLLESFNRYLQSRRARSLRSFLESADDLFQFWPPGLTRINGHMAIVSETPAVVESTAGPTAAFA
jgi:hypothetical protein